MGTDVQHPFRLPSELERRVLEHLLSVPFPGRDDLAEQMKSLTVRTIDSHGAIDCLELRVSGPEARVLHRVPTEGRFNDSDGMATFVLLHVVSGLMNELEFWKGDDSPIQQVDVDEIHLDPFGYNPASAV